MLRGLVWFGLVWFGFGKGLSVGFFLSFKVKVVGSGPTCQSLFAAAKKVTKNAANWRSLISR
jgi:hypothetical protein